MGLVETVRALHAVVSLLVIVECTAYFCVFFLSAYAEKCSVIIYLFIYSSTHITYNQTRVRAGQQGTNVH